MWGCWLPPHSAPLDPGSHQLPFCPSAPPQVRKYQQLAGEDIRFDVPLADACYEDRLKVCGSVPPVSGWGLPCCSLGGRGMPALCSRLDRRRRGVVCTQMVCHSLCTGVRSEVKDVLLTRRALRASSAAS